MNTQYWLLSLCSFLLHPTQSLGCLPELLHPRKKQPLQPRFSLESSRHWRDQRVLLVLPDTGCFEELSPKEQQVG